MATIPQAVLMEDMESIPQVPIIAIPEIHTVEQPEDSTKKIISEEAKRRQREAGESNLKKYHQDSGHNLVVESIPQLIGEEITPSNIITSLVQETIPEQIPEPKQDAHDKEAREQAGKLFGVSGRAVSGVLSWESKYKTLVLKRGTCSPFENLSAT